MDWLLPAIIAVLTGTVVLAATYTYLAASERSSYLVKWAAGWWIYALRFVFALEAAYFGRSVGNTLAVQLSSLLSGVFLLWGTYDFVRRPIPRLWGIFAAAIGCWIVVGSVWPGSLSCCGGSTR